MKIRMMVLMMVVVMAIASMSLADPPMIEDGLVARWAFDEGEGAVAYDSVGDNDGELKNGPVWAEGLFGNCLSFDGSNDYVDIDTAVMDFNGNTPFTVSLWMKGPGRDPQNAIIGTSIFDGWYCRIGSSLSGSEDPDATSFFFKIDDGSNDFYPVDTKTINIADDEWHHVAATIDGVNLKGYVDGQLQFTVPYSGVGNLGNHIYIGHCGRTSDYFIGLIDEVMVYNRALSSSEISTLAGNSEEGVPQLIAYWPFNEGQGDIAYDVVGDSDGVLFNDIVWAEGLVDGCLSFGGNSSYVDISPDTMDFSGDTSFSVSLWLKGPGRYPQNAIIGTNIYDGWYCRLGSSISGSANPDSTSFFFKIDDGSNDFYPVNVTTINIADDQWHHVAASIDGASLKGYVDGQLQFTVPYSGVGDLEDHLYIGHADSPSDHYIGLIDEVKIFSGALSAQDVLDIYESVEVQRSTTYHVDCATGSDDSNGLSRDFAFETIQHAIDSAGDGDTVLVWPGVYNESATNGINFHGKAITVKSAADAAVLEVESGYAVSFVQGEDSQSVLSNFVIRNSNVACFLLYSAPTIKNITIVNNQNGIIGDSSAPDIDSCIFWNNANGDLLNCAATNSFLLEELESQRLAYWKLNGDATDSAGDHDGTVINDPNWVTGKVADAVELDGENNYINFGDIDELEFGDNDFTISAWFYTKGPHDIGGSQYSDGTIVCKYRYDGGSYNGRQWYIGQDALGKIIFYTNPTGRSTGHEYLYSYNGGYQEQWVYVTCVKEGSVKLLFVNGILEGIGLTEGVVTGKSSPVYIGARQSTIPLKFFNGIIDEVSIYSRAFSGPEVLFSYRAGLAGYMYGPSPSFADPENDDYHLRSERGRYRATTDEWLLDNETSICIDRGNPAVNPSAERMPNGNRINMGAYGNTHFASMTLNDALPNKADLNSDGVVNFEDFAIFAEDWLKEF